MRSDTAMASPEIVPEYVLPASSTFSCPEVASVPPRPSRMEKLGVVGGGEAGNGGGAGGGDGDGGGGEGGGGGDEGASMGYAQRVQLE